MFSISLLLSAQGVDDGLALTLHVSAPGEARHLAAGEPSRPDGILAGRIVQMRTDGIPGVVVEEFFCFFAWCL